MLKKERLICDKLLEMMEDMPFDSIRVTRFVEYAGVSRSSFYLYFDSLQDVLDRIEGEVFGSLERALGGLVYADKPGPYTAQATEINAASMQFVIKNSKVMQVLMSSNGDPTFENKLTRHIQKILAELAPKAYPNMTAVQQRFWLASMLGTSLYTIRWFMSECGGLSENDLQELLSFTAKMYGGAKR